MSEHEKKHAPEQVSCELCLKEVPKTSATNAEASDYTLYFCGLECYGKWQEEQEKKTP